MSVSIERLCYLVLPSRDLAASARFAADELGLQPLPARAGEQAFRCDEHQYRVVYSGSAPRGGSIGLELRDAATLDVALQALAEAGIAARHDPALAARRNVRALITCTTPGGLHLELIVRPQHQGRRFFPHRDSGVAGLAAVVLRSTDVGADEALLTGLFNASVRDWVGDGVYLGLDAAHHRLALFPAARAGVLVVEFAVDGLDQVMQQYWRLGADTVAHGPGRRPASQQVFVTFEGPDALHYSFVAEGEQIAPDAPRRPRQFAHSPDSLCAWGSACRIAELNPERAPARPRLLHGVPHA